MRHTPCLFALLLLTPPAFGQALSPEEAVTRMTLPEGFSARCVAHEPMIRQPLSMSFDNRGRLWVLQFLQYPNPAGLKAVKQDQYLRTTWDRVPEAPPNGPKGLDKITICYDPDENGVYRQSKDFLGGLNLASGFCLGYRCVYVVQPPYLLRYADADEDDVPDGDPEVLLTGFGMDDTHSLANSLQWGPDGWLYGAAGSTSTCKITDPSGHAKRAVEFQQGVWRYHPAAKRFELFSEGGGNTYGLDFDKDGQAITGTNWGGFAMLHQRQGAYHVKGFSKHGPLHNPHAYGYFDHVPYKNFQGGHVTCGGIVYQADTYPKEFRDQYIAGNLLSNTVNWHKLTPKLSSFTAEHGGTLLDSRDPSCRPVDIIQGPDGCAYVADWYDKRAAHLDPVDDWDKTNGRIYRIEYKGMTKREPFDLRAKSVGQLADLLRHDNVWWRREARLELQGRRLKDGDATLNELPAATTGESRSEWWVRTVLDTTGRPAPGIEKQLLALEIRNGSYRLIAQYAASAKRADAALGIAMIERLLRRHELTDDPALSMLTWWAVETHLDAEPEKLTRAVLLAAMASDGAIPVVERTIRKLLSVGGARNAETACRWAAVGLAANNAGLTSAILRGVEAAIDGGSLHSPALMAATLKKVGGDERFLRVLAKCGDADSLATIRNIVLDGRASDGQRLKWLPILARAPGHDLDLPRLLGEAKSDPWKLGVIAALELGDAKSTPETLFKSYDASSAAVRRRIVRTLLARPAWAMELFRAYDAGQVPKPGIEIGDAKLALAFGDEPLTRLVEKHFGKVAVATAGEKKARIDSLNAMLGREPPGDAAAGKVLFARHCSACHQLHGEGGKVGPDLTTADRKNRAYLLAQIVDPSGHIRPEFVSHKIDLLDGRTETGLVTAQSAESLTLSYLRNGNPVTQVLARREIDTVEPLAVSLMPEKLLDAMSHDEVRHLFAYVQSDPKPGP